MNDKVVKSMPNNDSGGRPAAKRNGEAAASPRESGGRGADPRKPGVESAVDAGAGERPQAAFGRADGRDDAVRRAQVSAGGPPGKAGRQASSGARKAPERTSSPGRRDRLPANARELALDVLVRVELEGAFSNLLLNERLRGTALAPQDAALATELVYGTIQRRNTLDYYIGKFVAKGADRLEPWVRMLLRLSVYQLVYMDRIPDHAAVAEAVNIAKRRGHAGVAGLVNGVLRNMTRRRDELAPPVDLPPAERLALAHSHPAWLTARWIAHYGEATAERMCAADNRPPKVSVRVNRLRLTRDELIRELREAGHESVPSALSPDGVVVASGGNMALTDWYRDGKLSVQDESSMLVAAVVRPEPGMRVLDACAAPGGKTAHMAEQMGDRGEIWACDLHEHKIKLIRAQADRLGLASIRTALADARRLGERFPPGNFDRVLLDAPCSGLGVLRRKPDARWRKTPEEIRELARLQAELLEAVQLLVKPGGVLVYSTCTTEPEENERQIRAFLERHPEFAPDPFPPDVLSGRPDALAGIVQLLPHEYDSDGFFIARLARSAN